MFEYQLNKGDEPFRVSSPDQQFGPLSGFCNGVGTVPRCLQTTMNVSIFLSKLLIHPAPIF